MKHGLKISGGMEGDTIAINELGKQFVTFDATKLQECKKVATIHICDNIDSTWSIKSLTESCLGSIFKLETDMITKNCPTTPGKLKKTVKKCHQIHGFYSLQLLKKSHGDAVVPNLKNYQFTDIKC